MGPARNRWRFVKEKFTDYGAARKKCSILDTRAPRCKNWLAGRDATNRYDRTLCGDIASGASQMLFRSNRTSEYAYVSHLSRLSFNRIYFHGFHNCFNQLKFHYSNLNSKTSSNSFVSQIHQFGTISFQTPTLVSEQMKFECKKLKWQIINRDKFANYFSSSLPKFRFYLKLYNSKSKIAPF